MRPFITAEVAVVAPIEASIGLLLVHVPPAELVKVIVLPVQTAEPPVMAEGNAFTTKGVLTKQAVAGIVYIILGVPAMLPVIVADPVMVTSAGILEVQVPPGVTSVKTVDDPTQTVAVPVIGAGVGLTRYEVVAMQPVGKLTVMVAVPPEMPLTEVVVEGPAVTVAIVISLLLQVPELLVSVVPNPEHIVVVPVIAAGLGLTVACAVDAQPVPKV